MKYVGPLATQRAPIEDSDQTVSCHKETSQKARKSRTSEMPSEWRFAGGPIVSRDWTLAGLSPELAIRLGSNQHAQLQKLLATYFIFEHSFTESEVLI